MLSKAAADRMGLKLSKSCCITQNPLLTNTLEKSLISQISLFIKNSHNATSATFVPICSGKTRVSTTVVKYRVASVGDVVVFSQRGQSFPSFSLVADCSVTLLPELMGISKSMWGAVCGRRYSTHGEDVLCGRKGVRCML